MIENYPNSTIAFFSLNIFYSQKLNKNKCDFSEFITKLQRKLRIEFRP